MLGRLVLRGLGKLMARPIRRRLAEFDRATHDPRTAQAELLSRILARQEQTAFGRDHGFASVRTLADYRRSVPVAGYDYVAPYIERVQAGETDALLSDPVVHMFALTSGTTGARKLIPVTPQYMADYRRGWRIWGLRAMRDHKPIILRPMLQLVGDPDEYHTPAGTPCGNLSGLTARMQSKVIRWLYTVPAETGKIHDARSRYYAALLFSLTRKVGMILTANPSTLVTLARRLDADKESLIRDIADGTLNRDLDISEGVRAALTKRLKRNPKRAAELHRLAGASGRLLPRDCFPPERLLLGTWTGGSVGLYLRQLPEFYGEPWVRDLGLIASEGRMTLPLADDTAAGVLDIHSHYFEFVPEAEIDKPNPVALGCHEVAEGETYYIIPTTAAGLYRYHISDLVRVTGWYNNTPLVEFVGKGRRYSSLTGEKLSEPQVTAAMSGALAALGRAVSAYALAPCWADVPYYGLFLEESDAADGLAEELEGRLQAANVEYAAKRQSGRLGPVRTLVMPDGSWADWDRERLRQTGGSAEQYKRPCLIGDIDFRASMPVRRERGPALQSA